MQLRHKKASYWLLSILCLLMANSMLAQKGQITGKISGPDGPLAFANILLNPEQHGVNSDEQGFFSFLDLAAGEYTLSVSYLGLSTVEKKIRLEAGQETHVLLQLEASPDLMDEMVITGTLKEVSRLESPVPVEVYKPAFFKKNPTPNIYEALQNINGVRPQLNCQVCNTGDIHINGLEGPYTMVLIDGMPIVSSLATVYGLSGIPNSLIERVEIVKGPASSLYGSEAIGGLINIITKNPDRAAKISADIMSTTWGELNGDLGFRQKIGSKAAVLTGLNYYTYQLPIDNNQDNFTDVTLQERISIFQKWNFERSNDRLFTLAARYYWEDRWGGEMDWTPADRGGDEVYGEAIETERFEFIGQYQLPSVEKLLFSFSLNSHAQNSVYGDIPFLADQKIGFSQLTWDKKVGRHDLLLGSALRYTYYDDNTPATGGERNNPENTPDEIWLPGVFIQDEITFSPQHKILLGLRYDYNDAHGNIFTPRFAYKWSITETDILRLNAGTGFRVVNLFTEDHAALTGAREIVIKEALDPEQSYNLNLNYIKKLYFDGGAFASFDLSAWYTYFTNVILPDYDTHPNQIIYDNLDGSSVTKGLAVNADLNLPNGVSLLVGATLMDVSSTKDGERTPQILTERFTGTWSLSFPLLANKKLMVDYTGNLYGPMRLPLLGDLDQRPDESPWWSIQNIQLTYRAFPNFELYTGVKNILNWTPWKNQEQAIIARSFDPFDRGVTFDDQGQVLPTPDNPQALTFDPTYVFAPNQGIRGFLGLRYNLR